MKILFALLILTSTAAAAPPNVVVIMADDLAYNDLSCYGSKVIRTPALDTMAKEGVRLTSFYSGNTVCTPSRMALMTGAYPIRLGWRGGVVGYRIHPQNGLAPEALTIAEVFKSAGYDTAIVGKWHMGDGKSMLPMNQGFDSAYYITKSNNQTKKLFRDGKLIENPFDNRQLSEQFTVEAIRFIKAKRDKPFFIYLPYTAPHFPAQAHPDWRGKSNNAAYGDVVEELDHRVGQILRTLKEQKIDEQTIVVFISDNGVEPGQRKWARSKPFRGMKWSAMEGGNRVPCIVRWPGKIQAGRVIDDIVAAIDVLPTLAHVCDIDPNVFARSKPKLDGMNVWGTLTGKSADKHPRNEILFWHGWATFQAIRVGDWKLYVDQVKEIPATKQGPALFNLKDDPAEQKDLSAEFPDKVKAMKALAAKRVKEIEEHVLELGGPAVNQREVKWPAWLD